MTQTCRWNLISINANRKLIYFVDMCINTCKNLNSNYSSVYTTSVTNYCYCLSRPALNVTKNCDIKCIGKNNEQYVCGSSTSYSYRVYYFVKID